MDSHVLTIYSLSLIVFFNLKELPPPQFSENVVRITIPLFRRTEFHSYPFFFLQSHARSKNKGA
jgi:hypothetical protein